MKHLKFWLNRLNWLNKMCKKWCAGAEQLTENATCFQVSNPKPEQIEWVTNLHKFKSVDEISSNFVKNNTSCQTTTLFDANRQTTNIDVFFHQISSNDVICRQISMTLTELYVARKDRHV